MATIEDVRRIAAGLPETEMEGGGIALRVGGKLYAWPWLERVAPRRARVPRRDVLAIRVSGDLEKQALLSLDTNMIFTEPHYDGYPAVLVRLPVVPADLLEKLLTDAWRTRAPRRLRAAFDAGSPSSGA